LKHFFSFVSQLGRSRPAALLALSLGLAPAAFGQVTFAPAVNYGGGTAPQKVVVGDFNSDGRPDLATANFHGGDVSVLLNTGPASFAAAVHYGTASHPTSLAVGDFNDDGRPDLAVIISFGTFGTVSVLLNTGTGSFATSSFTAVPYGIVTASYESFAVAVGDFNGDNRADLAVTKMNANTVSVLLNTGTGSFAAPVSYGTGTAPNGLAVADFNEDSRADLVVTNTEGDNISVLLNTGTGGFAAPVNYGVGAYPNSVAVGDFNGDGHRDLATANYGYNNVSVLLGTGTGSFGPAVNYGAGSNPTREEATGIVVGDFNSDGRADLAVANYRDNVSVLLGAGTGAFAAAVPYRTGISPTSVAVGDFNGDGRPDLATADQGSPPVFPSNSSDNGISVLLNTTPATTLATAALTATSVGVYPNPATGRFTVSLPALAGARTVEATLRNSLGQVVRRQSVSLTANGTHFDVMAEGLGAGVYALRLQAGATTLTKRVVLQ
jgi:hypothetical protein